MADIFISYTSSDRDWAFWIGHELEALGHTPHIHEWEIPAGGDIMKWMEERHQAADHILCVVSAGYLDKPFASLERRAAQWAAAADERANFAIPVFVEACKAPTLLAPFKRCDLHGLSEEDARARLRTFLAPAVKPPPGPFPGGVKGSLPPTSGNPPAFPGKTALSNIPIRVPLHFMGRDDALGAIEMALNRYEGRVAIAALHGLRGVGKTTLAAAYAERHRGDYRATWWIRAQAETTLRADIVALGIRLKWVEPDAKEEPAVETVLERLCHEGEGVLLIFDNAIDADALKPYLPRGGAAKVLVTSNARAWRRLAEPVEIRLWPKEIGADYLMARTGRQAERAPAEALSEVLGGLPLAHEQAAAYCERLDISLAEYGKRFEAAPARLLDDRRHAPAEYHDGLTVAKTFALAIEEAAKLHPAAEPLIVHSAILAAEPIPLFLFSEAREKFGEPLATALAGDGLDEAVAALRGFALIDRETIVDERDASITTDAIRLHRLVREIAAARREGEARNSLRRVLVAALAAVYPTDRYENPASWPRCAVLTPHLLASRETEKAAPPPNADSAELLVRAGRYFHGRALYSEGGPLFQALAVRDKVLTKNLNNLAVVLMEQGDFAEARSLFEQALAIREKVLGPEHPDTARSLYNLVTCLLAQGDYAAAVWEKVLGPEHPANATILGHLVTFVHAQGNLVGRRPLHEDSIDMLGLELSNTASSLINSALAAEATPAFAVEKIAEKLLKHPDVATRFDDITRLIHKASYAREAEAVFHRAITIGEKTLGSNHERTQRYVSLYARLLLDTGRAAEALPLAQTALSTHEAASGANHPWTKDSALVTADALAALGRADEAAALRARYGLSDDGK